jgi:type 1 glutamine amidotransferase
LALLLVTTCAAAAQVEELSEHRQKEIWQAAPEQPRVAPKKPRTVLVFNTPDHLYPEKDPHAGYCVPYGSYAMQALGEKSGAYKPVVTSDLAMFLPENIGRFDAVVLNNTAGPWITPTDADIERPEFRKHGTDKDAVEQVLRKSLLDYVAGGRGLMAYHFATGANAHWPEFHELLGGRFSGHPWNEEVGIQVDEPDHPLVAAFGGKDFRLADEIYQHSDPHDRRKPQDLTKLRVLLSLDKENTNMEVKWIQHPEGEFAQAWVKPYGKGRVFYTGFGHRAELYRNPAILQFYLDAIQFACGDLQAPVEPRDGFVSLFDGKTLDGWDGDRNLWSVRDGAITGQTTDETKLKENAFLIWKAINLDEWNDYTVTAKGGHMVLKINGVTMCELDDRDPRRLVRGALALQVHVGPPMIVQFKDIYYRKL